MNGSPRSLRWRALHLALVLSTLALSACDRAPVAFDRSTAVFDEFSGESALKLTSTVTDFGPRPPGSEALERSRQWIEKTLTDSGWQVQRQTFTEATPQGDVEFVNLRARFTKRPEKSLWTRPTTVLLASHYDTKFYRDVDFSGANDPGSSIGALLEIARVAVNNAGFAEQLELVFFDGEEAFVAYTPADGLFGSRYYARQYRKWPDDMRMHAGVLLDMVGDRDLNIRLPRNSPQALGAKLCAAAAELGTRKYFGNSPKEITDDHVPLNGAGLPTLDVIDLDYAYWHTSADKVDKLSAESLQIVGRTVLLMVEKYVAEGE